MKTPKLLSHFCVCLKQYITTQNKGSYIFTTQNVNDFEILYSCPFEKDPFFPQLKLDGELSWFAMCGSY